MKLKITSTETRNSTTQGDYAYANGQILNQDGSICDNVTFIAFGEQRDAVENCLRVGQTLDVKIVLEDGVVKLVGLDEPKAAIAA